MASEKAGNSFVSQGLIRKQKHNSAIPPSRCSRRLHCLPDDTYVASRILLILIESYSVLVVADSPGTGLGLFGIFSPKRLWSTFAMALTVLTDDQVKTILENLTLDEYLDFKYAIATALHEYSNSPSMVRDGSHHQPHRVTTQNHDTGATTLYIPSCGPQGMGCKGKSLVMSE